jgi:hypothetical protein
VREEDIKDRVPIERGTAERPLSVAEVLSDVFEQPRPQQKTPTAGDARNDGLGRRRGNGSRPTWRSRLPDQWQRWLAENMLRGIPANEIRRLMLASGLPSEVVSAELQRMSDNPCYQFAADLMQQYRKLSSLLSVRAHLSSLSFGSNRVERRSQVSRNEFLERYYAANRPVILTDMLADSVARKRWTPQYLADTCGDAIVQIMSNRNSDSRYEINSASHRRQLPLSTYVRMVLEGGPTNDYYLVANNNFFDKPDFTRLRGEAPLISQYLDPGNADKRMFLWFGPASTVTPLHHDVMNVLIAQIYGRKRFVLIPPEQTPFLYNKIGVYSEVNHEKPDYSVHPLYRSVQPISFVLRPGDILFLPVGWWHHVKSLDTSIMISYTNFVFPNEYEWAHPPV